MRKNTVDEFVRKRVESSIKIANIDAELNGGALVEVCRILGKPLYMRVDHHDPERAKYELEEMRSIVKDVIWPEHDEQVNHYYTLEHAAERAGLSVVTLRRYIHSGRLPATKVGKEYRITEAALQDLVRGAPPATPAQSSQEC